MNDEDTNESVGTMDDSSTNARMHADYENNNKEGKHTHCSSVNEITK